MGRDEAWQRYKQLLTILDKYQRVAVAYSGGVDSTLLAYAACEALGPEHVLILHAAGDFDCLHSASGIDSEGC